MRTKHNKEKHKNQLIDNIKLYFGYKDNKHLKKICDLDYRKIKKIAKILKVYTKYYDDSLSEGDYYSWWQLWMKNY